MAKRKLSATTENQSPKTPLDLAEEHSESREPQATDPRPIPRSTDRISVSLLDEERTALENLASDFRRRNGRRGFKASRLVRIGIKMLLNASDEEILGVAEDVPDLEQLRVRQV